MTSFEDEMQSLISNIVVAAMDEVSSGSEEAGDDRQECEQRLREFVRARMTPGWQPIETAPANTLVLVFDGLGVTPAQLEEPMSIEDWCLTHGEEPDEGEYEEYLEEEPFGWTSYSADSVEYLEPTHWMPLPPAPSPSQQGEKA